MTPTDDDAARLLNDAFSDNACDAASLLDPMVLHHMHVFGDTVAPVHIELKLIPAEDLPLDKLPSIVSLIAPLVSSVIEGCVEDMTEESFTCPIAISSAIDPHDIMRMKVRISFGVHKKPTDDWTLDVGIIIGYIIDAVLLGLKQDSMHAIHDLSSESSLVTFQALSPVIETLHDHIVTLTEILSHMGGMNAAELSSFSDAALTVLRLPATIRAAMADIPATVRMATMTYLRGPRVHDDE
jgi:hypothetical protein